MEVFFTEKNSSAEYTDFFHIHEYADLCFCVQIFYLKQCITTKVLIFTSPAALKP